MFKYLKQHMSFLKSFAEDDAAETINDEITCTNEKDFFFASAFM